MVVEIKIAVVIVLSVMIGGGGVYVAATENGFETQVDNKAPESRVLPEAGQYTAYYVASRAYDRDGAAMQFVQNEVSMADPDVGFEVRWSGTDGALGSGILYYDVEYRYENGSWELWKWHTSQDSGMFYPEKDGTYYFRCRATDRSSNTESFPDDPDAMFVVHSVDLKGNFDQEHIESELKERTHGLVPCTPGAYCGESEE